MEWYRRSAAVFVALLMLIVPSIAMAGALQTSSASDGGMTIRGTVHNLAGGLVPGASVRLEGQDSVHPVVVKTDGAGAFEFTGLHKGQFSLCAESMGWTSHGRVVLVRSEGGQAAVDLVLDVKEQAGSDPDASAHAMEFSDAPTFTVAGVSDWTAAGGHGSDSALRTSEDLARNTLTLKSTDASATAMLDEKALLATVEHAPQSFEAVHRLGEFYLRTGKGREAIPVLESAFRIDPTDRANEYELALAYDETNELAKARQHVAKLSEQANVTSGNVSNDQQANLHRLAGELDEKMGDPLAAVREDEQAVRLDPSEQNYFSWGTELLLHRAIWQAAEVFKDGVKAYPRSARMLTGLGTALFAGAEYDKAADRLCEASDLDQAAAGPYLFMGKVDREAPSPSACIEQRLARFVQEQPGNAVANYFYAMALLKRKPEGQDASTLPKIEGLLTKALSLDSRCVDAALQLGILASAQGHYAAAIGFYKTAIRVDPQLGEAHYRLGVALDRTGQSARAKNEFLVHDALEKKQADEVERQREQIKQFQIVLQAKPVDSPSH